MSTRLFAGFGVLWIVTGLMEIHDLTPGVCLFVVLGSLLMTAAGVLGIHSRGTFAFSSGHPQREQATRMLSAVTIIQAVSIATAAVILTLLQLPEYMVAAIAIIVGAHLLPLTVVSRNDTDRLTSGLLLAWPAGCLAFLDRSRVAVPVALGAGCIMLAGMLLRRFRGSTADVAPDTPREF